MAPFDIESYVKGIAFAIAPDNGNIALQVNLTAESSWRALGSAVAQIDCRIVTLPERDKETRATLEPLNDVPGMCTFAIAAVINTIVRNLGDDQVYLNIGTWHGYSLLAGMLGNPGKRVVGVDNFSRFGGPREALAQRLKQHGSPRHDFFEADYEDYFRERHQGAIGLYYYDGNHEYEHQLKGLQLAEPHLGPGALILVDDTNWDGPRKATVDFMAQSRSDFDVIWDVRTAHNRHPTAWNGVMLLRRRG